MKLRSFVQASVNIGAYLCMPSLVVVILYDVLARSLSSELVLQGSSEIAELLLLWIFLCALPLAVTRNNAIRMDFLYKKFHGFSLQLADAVSFALILICLLTIVFGSVTLLVDHIRYEHRSTVLGIHYWVGDVIILLYALTATVHVALEYSAPSKS